MLKKTHLRDRAREWIERLPAGTTFGNGEMYGYLWQNFQQQCRTRGDAAHEPRFHNDARWAIQDAKRDRVVQDTGTTGQHQRL